MTDPLYVSAYENKCIRLFKVDITPEALEKLKNPKPDMPPYAAAVAELVGLDWVDGTYAELFDLSDLEGLGLANYLLQGAGVSEAVITQHRDRLDALEGIVLILYTRAFEEKEVQLHPRRNVVLVEHFEEESTPIAFSEIPSKAARTPGPTQPAPSTPHGTALKAMLMLPAIAVVLGGLIWLLSR